MLNTLTSPGAPGVITAELDEWLQDTVIHGKPLDVGYDTVRWTRALLAELLNKEFGIEVAGSTVSLHVKHLDLSYQQPAYRPRAQDPQEVEYFLNETFPRLLDFGQS